MSIIICRRASDSLIPGFQLGVNCKVCGLALQVSPKGKQQIDDGMFAFCNACGFDMAKRLQAEGIPIDVAISAAARRRMEKIAEELKCKAKCDFCGLPTRPGIHKAYTPKRQIVLATPGVPGTPAWVDQGVWAACAACAALIDAAAWKTLINRAKQFSPGIRKAAEKGLIDEVAGLVAETWGGVFDLPPEAFL